MTRSFPDDFWWGIATAGHQNEGDNHASDTWFLEHVCPTAFVEPSGPACRSWWLWPEDLDLVAGMGCDTYRFSVEWSRIEPEPGHVDRAALDHYEAVVDGCRQRGLRPVVTMNHFTAPHWFAMRGGWLHERAPESFAEHCARVMDRFGERLAAVVTLNEPNLTRMLAWAGLSEEARRRERAMLEAASAKAGVARYRVANVVLEEEFPAMRAGMSRAHRAARDAIKARRPALPVGLSVAVVDDQVVSGGEDIRDRKRAEVYDHWLRLAAEDDFVGVQNYERLWYGPGGRLPPSRGAVLNEMGSAIEPLSLGEAVRYAHQVSGVPVLVTEHGIATEEDELRAGFLEPSLAGLHEVVAEGVPVMGYCHWTLMDNFEWVFGYTSHLGLHEVDRETFARRAKPSAEVFAKLVRGNGISGS